MNTADNDQNWVPGGGRTVRTLGGQAMFFLMGNVFTLVVGLPFQIYLARVLGVDGIGVFSLLDGGVALASGLVAFGVAATMPKFIAHHLERREYASIRRLFSLGLRTLLVAGVVVCLAILTSLPFIDRRWPELAPHHLAVVLMSFMVPLTLVMFLQQQSLRGFHEIRYMVIGSSFLQLASKVLLTVVLFAAGWRLAGYALAVVLSSVVAAFWMSAGLWRRLRALPVDRPATAPSVDPVNAWRTYAKVQYADSLVGLGASYLDRFLLAVFASASSVGVLAIVRQLQTLPVVFLNMFISVAAPMFSAAHSREDDGGRQHIYGLATDWVFKASAPLLIFLLLYAQPTLDLYGPGVATAGTVPLRIMVSAQIVNVLAGTIGTVLNMSGCERDHLRITIVQTISAVILLILLTPPFGLVGVAVTVAAATIFNNVASLYVAKRRLNLRWYDERYRKWLLPLAMATSMGFAGCFVFQNPNAFTLIACLASLYAVFFGAMLAQGLHEDDRELLGQVRVLLRRPA